MPDSILQKVMSGVNASKQYIANPPVDRVVASPMPSQDEYIAIP